MIRNTQICEQQLATVKKMISKQTTSTSNPIMPARVLITSTNELKLQGTLFGYQNSTNFTYWKKKRKDFDNYIITECIYPYMVRKCIKL